jgi:hypothetical protein
MQTAFNDAMNQLSADLMWPTILNQVDNDQSERGRSRENALLQHVLMALTLQLEKTNRTGFIPPDYRAININALLSGYSEDVIRDLKDRLRKALEGADWEEVASHRAYDSD